MVSLGARLLMSKINATGITGGGQYGLAGAAGVPLNVSAQGGTPTTKNYPAPNVPSAR